MVYRNTVFLKEWKGFQRFIFSLCVQSRGGRDMLFGIHISKNEGEYSHVTNNEDKMGFRERQVEMQWALGCIRKPSLLLLVPGSFLFSWMCVAVW